MSVAFTRDEDLEAAPGNDAASVISAAADMAVQVKRLTGSRSGGGSGSGGAGGGIGGGGGGVREGE